MPVTVEPSVKSKLKTIAVLGVYPKINKRGVRMMPPPIPKKPERMPIAAPSTRKSNKSKRIPSFCEVIQMTLRGK